MALCLRCPEMATRLLCMQPLNPFLHVMDNVEEIVYGEVLDEVARLQGVMRDDENEEFLQRVWTCAGAFCRGSASFKTGGAAT